MRPRAGNLHLPCSIRSVDYKHVPRRWMKQDTFKALHIVIDIENGHLKNYWLMWQALFSAQSAMPSGSLTSQLHPVGLKICPCSRPFRNLVLDEKNDNVKAKIEEPDLG